MENKVDDKENVSLSPEEFLAGVKAVWEAKKVIEPLDVDWLISQAGFANQLDKAGERMKNAAVAYVQLLEEIVEQKQERIDELELELSETTK